jgi:hypothetical protein
LIEGGDGLLAILVTSFFLGLDGFLRCMMMEVISDGYGHGCDVGGDAGMQGCNGCECD